MMRMALTIAVITGVVLPAMGDDGVLTHRSWQFHDPDWDSLNSYTLCVDHGNFEIHRGNSTRKCTNYIAGRIQRQTNLFRGKRKRFVNIN